MREAIGYVKFWDNLTCKKICVWQRQILAQRVMPVSAVSLLLCATTCQENAVSVFLVCHLYKILIYIIKYLTCLYMYFLVANFRKRNKKIFWYNFCNLPFLCTHVICTIWALKDNLKSILCTFFNKAKSAYNLMLVVSEIQVWKRVRNFRIIMTNDGDFCTYSD